MVWVIVGADRVTGKLTVRRVEAQSEDEARRHPSIAGLLISEVTPDDGRASEPAQSSNVPTLDYSTGKPNQMPRDVQTETIQPKKQAGGLSWIEGLIVILSIFCGLCFMFASATSMVDADHHHAGANFATDNAVGATANAAESIAASGIGYALLAVLLWMLSVLICMNANIRDIGRRG